MIKIKKIKPLFTSVITTMDKYDDDIIVNGIIDTSKQKGSLKEYQKVVAIGSSVRDIEVGDLVQINPSRYAVRKHQEGSLKDGVVTDNPVTMYNFNVVEIDDCAYLHLQDRDIDFVVTDYDQMEEQAAPTIWTPGKKEVLI